VEARRALIYRKTDRGKQEVAERAFRLESRARRLLILIDGHRDAAELSVYVRAGELEGTLALLVTEGFVEAVGADEPGGVARAPAANDPVVFAGIKIRAMTEIRSRVGPISDRLVAEIKACSTPLELREKLRSVENALIHLLGRAEGVALARRIGAELTQLVPKAPSN